MYSVLNICLLKNIVISILSLLLLTCYDFRVIVIFFSFGVARLHMLVS